MSVLELPFRAGPRTGVPETPRHLRAWLKRLDTNDARDRARRLADLIHAQNQLVLSPQRRLQLLEILRPAVREPLDALAARVQAQSLPLPERTRQIAQLQRELLGALIIGYEMVSSATGPAPRSSRRALALVAERVIAARGELLLRHIEAEEPLPTAFWRRTYAVFVRAESDRLARRRVRDRQWAGARRPTPTDAFVSMVLLALAHPHGLRPGEAARIHRATQQWARLARLARAKEAPADANERGSVFALGLDAVTAPGQWRQRAGEVRETERALDVGAIVREVEQLHARAIANGHTVGYAPDDDTIGPTGLKRLLDNWNPRPLASSRQIPAQRPTEVALGLAAVHECLDPGMPMPGAAMRTERARHYTHLPENVLQTIATDDGPARETPKYPHARAAEDAQHKAHKETAQNESDWLVEAADHRGFTLRWQGTGRSGATVGELVAFREDSATPWQLGVVRWLQFINDTQFAIGCELLCAHPKAIRVRHEPANRHRRSAHRGPGEPALLLPNPGAEQDTATVLVPAHQFRADDILELDADDRTLRVQLTTMREQSVYFARFELTPAPARGRTSGIPYGPADRRSTAS